MTIQEMRYRKAAKAIHKLLSIDDNVANDWDQLSPADKETARLLGRAVVDLWDALTMEPG